MIILGIDPGTATVGYGVVEKAGTQYRVIEYGVLQTPKELPAPQRLQQIYEGVNRLLHHFLPDVVVTEQLLFSTNRRTAMEVARAIGVVLLAIAQQGIEWQEYTPLTVKQTVTGYGGADKKQVQSMVQRLLRLETIPKPDDAADALALCLCHAHQEKLQRLMSG